MKTKCYSVRIKSIIGISVKAYKIEDFNGNSDIFPKSAVFGLDYDVIKSDAYWLAEWILEKKEITYSKSKVGWYNHQTEQIEPNIVTIIEKFTPETIEPTITLPDDSLIRQSEQSHK